MGENKISLKKQEIGIAEVELSKEGVSQLVVRQAVFTHYLSSPTSVSSCSDLGAKFVINIKPSSEFEKAKHLIPMMYLVDN